MQTETPQATAADPSRRQTVPPLLQEFCIVSVAISLLSAVYCVSEAFALHRQYPYSWPYFDPAARFSDFSIYQAKFNLLGQAKFWTTGFPFTYPAPMGVLYDLFFKGTSHPLRFFLLFVSLAFVIPAVLFGQALHKRGLSTTAAAVLASVTLLLSWPAALLWDRANVEIFVWVALAAGTWAYSRGKEWVSAILFGLGAALKLFPFVLLMLFFTRRKFPKLLVGLLVLAVVTVASLAFMGPTAAVANQGVSNGLAFFHDHYMAEFRAPEQGVDHSLFGLVKMLVVHIKKTNYAATIHVALGIFLPISAIGGCLLYFVLIRRLPWLNQLLVLSIASIYLTAFSGDGTLLHLYYGFALCCFVALDAWRKDVEVPGLRTIFLCFAFLFSTESFFIFHGYRFEGQAKCIVLGILLVCCLRYPLGPPIDNKADAELPAFPDARRIAPLAAAVHKHSYKHL